VSFVGVTDGSVKQAGDIDFVKKKGEGKGRRRGEKVRFGEENGCKKRSNEEKSRSRIWEPVMLSSETQNLEKRSS